MSIQKERAATVIADMAGRLLALCNLNGHDVTQAAIQQLKEGASLSDSSVQLLIKAMAKAADGE